MGDPNLRRLVRAAVRFAEVLEVPESARTMSDAYLNEFMARDEELREASLAYTNGLSDRDRERLSK